MLMIQNFSSVAMADGEVEVIIGNLLFRTEVYFGVFLFRVDSEKCRQGTFHYQ